MRRGLAFCLSLRAHWLACALGHKASRENLSVFYQRASRLFAALALARGDGRYAKMLRHIARVDLLIIDDWGRNHCER
jgi:DNA replication protein DnaC